MAGLEGKQHTSNSIFEGLWHVCLACSVLLVTLVKGVLTECTILGWPLYTTRVPVAFGNILERFVSYLREDSNSLDNYLLLFPSAHLQILHRPLA